MSAKIQPQTPVYNPAGPLKRKVYNLFLHYFQTGELPTYCQMVSADFYTGSLHNFKQNELMPASAHDLFKGMAKMMRLSQTSDTLESARTGKQIVPLEDFGTKIQFVHTRGGLKGPGHRGTNNSVNEVKKLYSVGERNFGITEAEVKRIVINCPDEDCIRKIWLAKLNTGFWPGSKPMYYQDRSLVNIKGTKELPGKFEHQSGLTSLDVVDLTMDQDEPLDLSCSTAKKLQGASGNESATVSEPHLDIKMGPGKEECKIPADRVGSDLFKMLVSGPNIKFGPCQMIPTGPIKTFHLHLFKRGPAGTVNTGRNESEKMEETSPCKTLDKVQTQHYRKLAPAPSKGIDTKAIGSEPGESENENTEGTKAKKLKRSTECETACSSCWTRTCVSQKDSQRSGYFQQQVSEEPDLPDIGSFLQRQPVFLDSHRFFQNDDVDALPVFAPKITPVMNKEQNPEIGNSQSKPRVAKEGNSKEGKLATEVPARGPIVKVVINKSKKLQRPTTEGSYYCHTKDISMELEEKRKRVKLQILEHVKKSPDAQIREDEAVASACEEEPDHFPSLSPQLRLEANEDKPKKTILETLIEGRNREASPPLQMDLFGDEDSEVREEKEEEEQAREPQEVLSDKEQYEEDSDSEMIEVEDSPPTTPTPEDSVDQTSLVPCTGAQFTSESNEEPCLMYKTGDGVAQRALSNVISIVKSMRQDMWLMMADDRKDAQERLINKIDDAVKEIKESKVLP